MVGFWFAIVGFLFGSLCSLTANRKNRNREDWFILGFVLSFVALAVLLWLPDYSENKDNSYTEENHGEAVTSQSF